MFTQPPPPTIAGEVESLKDELGVKIHENDSDDHVNHKFSIENSEEDPINKETDLAKEYDEVEKDVEQNKDENDSDDYDDHVNHKFSIEDSDEDPINKGTDLVKEYNEVEEDV